MSPLVPGAPEVFGGALWFGSLLLTACALAVWSRGVRRVTTLPAARKARPLLELAVILMVPVVGPAAFLATTTRRRAARRG